MNFPTLLLLFAAVLLPNSFGAERIAAYLQKPIEWFRSEEGTRAIENIVSWQTDRGDWPKNTNTAAAPFRGDRSKLKGTFDNGATLPELRILARGFSATANPVWENAFLKGFDHVLDAQYPNGGWPQSFPVEKGYGRHITFNDQCMVNIMNFVRDAARSENYAFLDETRREQARRSFEKGIDCILKCQIRVQGKLTAWCAQHNEVDFSPRAARSFEPVSVSGAESAGIVRLLMSLENPSREVINAIDGAVKWFDEVKLTGIKEVLVDDAKAPRGKDKRVIQDSNATPIWARFYDLQTMRPIFVDRDGAPKRNLADIGYERRNGYAWLGNWPAALSNDYPRWREKLGAQAAMENPKVIVQRTPNGGIQPQVVADSQGVVHLIYYKGKEAAGDIFYVQRKPGQSDFSAPIRVNSRDGSAIAAGTIRGAQLAVGKDARVHVIWNGGNGAAKARIGEKEITPLLYTRMTDDRSAFEPERNLITYAEGLDGGSSIAADAHGNVYATWHAHIPGGPEGEEGRAVFVARSVDEGKSFAPERRAIAEKTGACGCCGMKSFADENGATYILYRGALEMVNRDQILLVSPKPGAPFKIVNKHPWKIEGCPMSSAFFSGANGGGAIAAWETAGQIFFARADANATSLGKIISPAGSAKRRHPVAVNNSRGETLLAWSEGTAWAKGGTAVWQTFDAKGNPLGDQQRAEGLPVWSMVAAYAEANGQFILIY